MRTVLLGLLLTFGLVAAVPDGARSGAPPLRASSVSNDTLQYQVRAGQPLVVALPALYNGRAASYRLLRGPSMSWLVDHGFFWRTLPTESGTMPVLVRRVAPGVEPDTLVLMVTLTGG